MTDRRLRVIVADDNYIVREGTRRLLHDTGEVEVLAAVADAEELLSAVRREDPDAVVVDIRMPPTHRTEGIVAARTIRERHPRVGVVVLSGHADPAYTTELFADGTDGLAYLLKDNVGDSEQLLRALRATAAGGSVVDPAVVAGLVARRARTTSKVERLTERELQVLQAMAEGHTNASIAAALCLSESAVAKHINAIFAKLDLNSTETAVHRRVAAVLAFLAERGA